MFFLRKHKLTIYQTADLKVGLDLEAMKFQRDGIHSIKHNVI